MELCGGELRRAAKLFFRLSSLLNYDEGPWWRSLLYPSVWRRAISAVRLHPGRISGPKYCEQTLTCMNVIGETGVLFQYPGVPLLTREG